MGRLESKAFCIYLFAGDWMSEIYFNGVWRMDWGLGNPNKTAALIATLMVAVWGLAYFRRWGFWVAVSLFTVLGICLVHTFSRGGLVAVALGLAPVVFMASRPWHWSRLLSTILSLVIIIAASSHLSATDRFSQSLYKKDQSISNRLIIWNKVPTMMVDAPKGWGVGNAGRAYMDWYQPLDRNEAYRTLVNSHLTWLVELGWTGRFVYISGWLLVFVVCWPTSRSSWLAVSFGVWLSFFIGASFSSVAESIWLWIVPVLFLIAAFSWRFLKNEWVPPQVFCIAPAISAICIIFIALCFSGSKIHNKGKVIIVGRGDPIWIVADRKVLGNAYQRTLRAYEPLQHEQTVGLVECIKDLPNGPLASVIISGDGGGKMQPGDLARLKSLKNIVLANPSFDAETIDLLKKVTGHVIVGEFSSMTNSSAWANTEKLAGIGDFIPEWPSVIIGR